MELCVITLYSILITISDEIMNYTQILFDYVTQSTWIVTVPLLCHVLLIELKLPKQNRQDGMR